jgi:hypothetical protein
MDRAEEARRQQSVPRHGQHDARLAKHDHHSVVNPGGSGLASEPLFVAFLLTPCRGSLRSAAIFFYKTLLTKWTPPATTFTFRKTSCG